MKSLITIFVVTVVVVTIDFGQAQICLSIDGPCVAKSCLTGAVCIEDACCVVNSSQNCNNTLGDLFCDAHVHQCNDPHMADAMKIQCAKSCMTCDLLNPSTTTTTTTTRPGTNNTECKDVEPNCDQYKYLCLNNHYFDLLTRVCKKTCNRCNYVPHPPHHNGTCADKVKPDGTSDCHLEKHLCEDPIYYDIMTKECPKSCNRC